MQDPKNRQKSPSGHHRTTSQIRHVSTIGKKLVKEQYFLHMSSKYGGLRPTNGWNPFGSLGHPCKFQRVSSLGSVTSRHFSSGRQPNFAALNRGRHPYSAGRPSHWALAHILVVYYWADLQSVHVFRCYDSIAPNAKYQRVLCTRSMPRCIYYYGHPM